jgi:GNAT superfamily N-acetyltransferase
MDKIEIRIEPASTPAESALIAALDHDILRRYPGEPVNGIDAPEFERSGGVFAVGYVDGTPAACGAFRPWGDAAEVKRMFVAPEFRGRGLARKMLQFLEAEATRRGYTRAVLETGTGQPEAIGLYTSAGWQPIAVFGPYVGSPISTCFEKRLV